jgi:UDP-N-acetylglucosamine acyltransferase
MHRLLYRDGLTLDAARAAIAALEPPDEAAAADRRLVLEFLAGATRGIVR